jgi:hypothetical protein
MTDTATEGQRMTVLGGAGFPGLGAPPPPEAPAGPQPAAPVPDAPTVRAGSYYDAKVLRAKLQALLGELDRAHDHLAMLLDLAQERRIFLMLEGPDGQYFRDWTAFVVAPQPWGLGMSEALIAALVKEQRDPQRRARLVLEGPQVLQTRAAPRKGRAAGTVRGLEYSLQRLRRDRPDLLEKVATGELPSIQAAAEAAGHRPPFSAVLVEPMAIARLAVSRLDEGQQRELIDLIQHPEKIIDPAHGRNPHWDHYRARTTPPDVLAQQRAEAAAAKRAHREAYEVAYKARRRATREAQRAQAHSVGLPSLAEAAG